MILLIINDMQPIWLRCLSTRSKYAPNDHGRASSYKLRVWKQPQRLRPIALQHSRSRKVSTQRDYVNDGGVVRASDKSLCGKTMEGQSEGPCRTNDSLCQEIKRAPRGQLNLIHAYCVRSMHPCILKLIHAYCVLHSILCWMLRMSTLDQP